MGVTVLLAAALGMQQKLHFKVKPDSMVLARVLFLSLPLASLARQPHPSPQGQIKFKIMFARDSEWVSASPSEYELVAAGRRIDETLSFSFAESVVAPRILGPRRLNISAPSHSRTLSCEVISLGATQIQWLRQIGGEADAADGRKTVVVFDYVFEVKSLTREGRWAVAT